MRTKLLCSEDSAPADQHHSCSHLNYNVCIHSYVSTRTIAKIHAFMQAKKEAFLHSLRI